MNAVTFECHVIQVLQRRHNLLAENNRHNRNEFSIEHYKVGESRVCFFFKEVENSLKK